MAVETQGLSDKAMAVFAFAAYHQLESGQKISSVVQRDGAGHKADDEAVAELQARGLVEADGQSIQFTADGESALDRVIQGLRNNLNGG
jgi:chromosome segregation and condensation protein ScpB